MFPSEEGILAIYENSHSCNLGRDSYSTCKESLHHASIRKKATTDHGAKKEENDFFEKDHAYDSTQLLPRNWEATWRREAERRKA